MDGATDPDRPAWKLLPSPRALLGVSGPPLTVPFFFSYNTSTTRVRVGRRICYPGNWRWWSAFALSRKKPMAWWVGVTV